MVDRNIGATVVDLRSVAPLAAVVSEIAKTVRVIVDQEDYARITTEATIPHAHHLEIEVLPPVTCSPYVVAV